MRKLTVATLIIGLMASGTSCKKEVIGEGPVSTQTRVVANFTGIDLRMNGNVFYTNDTAWKVAVTAKESIHGMLETKVVNSQLLIRYSNGRTYDADETIRINVSGPELNSFALNTSGSIYFQNNLTAQNLYLRSKGSGSIYLKDVIASGIDAECTVSGSIVATGGSTSRERLKTNASGTIDFSAVAAKRSTVRIVGSGDIRVKAFEHLNATINGSGSVYFSGSPSITTHINGTGKLIRL